MKKQLLVTAALALGIQLHANIPFVDSLLAKMTLEEKLGQLNLMPAGGIVTGGKIESQTAEEIMNGRLGGIFNIKGREEIEALQRLAVEHTRLHIPLLVGMDIIHGYETIFPIPLAMSCSWDLEGVKESARIAAEEASCVGIGWTYSPMVDVSLDARWGRISEGNGEDPYLGGLMGAAMVRGYQGDYSQPNNIMACVKHFALYGAVEGGLDYNTVDMSRQRMFNQYFPPYEAAVKAGAGSVMSSFNLVDGQHATANKWLMTDVLRNKWNFDGFVVTDYASIHEMGIHGFGTLEQNSAKALKAGTDMDMCSKGYIGTLKANLANGSVTMAEIDLACRRVLEAKYKLGLFQNPYKHFDAHRESQVMYSAAHRKAARDLAAETFVLLKNENNLLPLQKKGTIALIGPLTQTRGNLTGTWCVAQDTNKYQTLEEGFRTALKGRAKLLCTQGCNLTADEATQRAAEFGKHINRIDAAKGKAQALKIAKQADVVVCAMGECADFSGESSSRADLNLPGEQMELLKALVATGKPVVLLNFAGRPTVLNWESEHVNAIMNVWFGGSETPDAICDVLFGDKCPAGRLTVSLPRITGQEPLYYNHLNTGRPVPYNEKAYRKYASNYIEVRNGALYPFGYGLSYTTFGYSDYSVKADGTNVTATVKVTNTGKRDAYEVVQLYVHDVFASLARPVRELKNFERIYLKAGESKTVTMTIGKEALSFYDNEGNLVFEPGEFDIMVGPNSREWQSQRVEVK